jgi:hypothetical protein
MNEATLRRYMENMGRDPEEIEETVGRWAEDAIDNEQDDRAERALLGENE